MSFVAEESIRSCITLNFHVTLSLLIWNSSSTVPCLSWPWYFWSVLVSHFVKCLSIWVCLNFLHDWILMMHSLCSPPLLGQIIIEVKLCSSHCQVICSSTSSINFAPLLMSYMFSTVKLLFFFFIINKYFVVGEMLNAFWSNVKYWFLFHFYSLACTPIVSFWFCMNYCRMVTKWWF